MFRHIITALSTVFKRDKTAVKREVHIPPAIVANLTQRAHTPKISASLTKLRRQRKVRMRIQRASRQSNRRAA